MCIRRDIQEDDPAAVRDREDGEADGLDTGGKRAARASVKRAKRPKLTVALLKVCVTLWCVLCCQEHCG